MIGKYHLIWVINMSEFKDRLCYPYLYEESSLIDFEIYADELASTIGQAASYINEDKAFYNELIMIIKKIYHISGSVRGNLAIDEIDIAEIVNYCQILKGKLDNLKVFSLPIGSPLAATLHLCRSKTKILNRILYKVSLENINVDEVIFKLLKEVSNYFFLSARYANKIEGIKEVTFTSKSY